MRKLLFLFSFSLQLSIHAQSVYVPLNNDYYHLIDRYEVRQGHSFDQHHSSVRPFLRKKIVSITDSVFKKQTLSEQDKFNLQYLRNDSWEWANSVDNQSKKPIFKHFYKVKSDLYHVDSKDFKLHVNPVIYAGLGRDSNAPATPFINSRGVEIRGSIDGKVGFYSYLVENQMNFPGYVVDRIDETIAIPGEGFWKDFNEDGYDFFTARGYITFNATKHIGLQVGHDRNFIGNGYRSLILSDYGPSHFFVKINTKVWKINYTNLFTSMVAELQGNANGLTGAGDFTRKNIAFHHLSIDISKRLNIGLFEAVVFSRADSIRTNSFDLRYINPIIFYRAVEQQTGSPDNVLLGLDYKWHVKKNIMTYGQFFFDEFVLDELRSGDGFWANKFGLQVGGKVTDLFGVPNLDAQLEANFVRPYAYTHNTLVGSYSNYNQPLAHPSGANFREFIGILKYQPLDKLFLTAKAFYTETGLDTANLNVGTNVLLDNSTRNRGVGDPNFGNEIGQGIATEIMFGDLTASYMFKHNLFADLRYIYRRQESELPEFESTTNFFSVSVRWNIPLRLQEF
ncbi:MAG: hypothetical protein AAF363_04990 [Bacteroidota bacterium]